MNNEAEIALFFKRVMYNRTASVPTQPPKIRLGSHQNTAQKANTILVGQPLHDVCTQEKKYKHKKRRRQIAWCEGHAITMPFLWNEDPRRGLGNFGYVAVAIKVKRDNEIFCSTR